MRPLVVSVIAVVVGALGACGGTLQAFPRALGDWQAGRRAAAVEAARDEIERWRDGNDLGRAEVDREVRALEALLADDVPLVVPDDRAPRVPGDGAPDLATALREDLLSNRATVVVRALRSAAGLGLVQRGPEILTVIFRRDPVESDGGLLADATPALRSVVTKRLALRALEQLATPNRPVL